MKEDKIGTIVSLGIMALGLIWLAYMMGTWRGEAKAHAERDKADMKRRLWALEEKNTSTSQVVKTVEQGGA